MIVPGSIVLRLKDSGSFEATVLGAITVCVQVWLAIDYLRVYNCPVAYEETVLVSEGNDTRYDRPKCKDIIL